APVLVDSKLGIGLRFRDEEKAIECTTLMREAIKQRIIEEQKSEEVRLLYVALTRAREKMFITASLENAEKKLRDLALKNPYSELDSENLATRNDGLLWFVLPLLRSKTGEELFGYAEAECGKGEEIDGLLAHVIRTDELSDEEVLEETTKKAEALDAEEIRRMIEFKYEDAEAAKTQSKLTATGMGKLIAEQSTPKRKKASRPRFIMERSLTPAERGTALHLAMQFVDFEKCRTESGVASEMLRLYEKKYLTKAQVEAVSPEKILEFATSPIGEEIRNAKSVMREFKFSVLLPADELLENPLLSGEKVLMQGVMDMCYETEKGITILDFKTDKVRPEKSTLEKYKAQLEVYRRAYFEMTGKRAARLVLYLVSTGDFMEV
ncbi:MAG: PD-(D/E)XK nuclease family protein, partial [Oscillospiraceae bacterium]|nr:PD-(D/E)XK nuclease family protein [Oscillospiraceae bacterium]